MHRTCYGCRHIWKGSYEEPCVSCTYINGKRNWEGE